MPDIHDHQHADDLLEDFALGTLSAADEDWMRAHIASCATCQEELGPLLDAVAALPFAAPEPDVPMPAEMWGRIERRIAPDAGEAAIIRPEPSAWGGRRWLAVAALMLLSLAGGVLLGQRLDWFDDEPAAREIAVQFTDPNATARGTLRYLPDEQLLVFDADDLPPLEEGFVYQAWLIEGDTPVPAGILASPDGSLASVADISAYDAFAITVEPGPLGNAVPTTDPILVAPLAESGTG